MSLSTIFLLGAGASHQAGIMGIESMTSAFINDLPDLVQSYYFENESSLEGYDASNSEDAIKAICKDINKGKKGEFNIELLLEALTNLNNEEHILYSLLNYPKKYLKYKHQYGHLKNILIKFIRNQCENMSSVNYLNPLIAFRPKEGALDIFTLNYDGTIEKMCKENDVIYTDGFKEEWNSDYFLEDNLKIRLYKLHGSLYWYKTEKGKYIKLPIKNVDVEKLTYFMDEKISETLIWPMITKDYSTGPFPWLMEEFRKKLRTCDLCVVLGYSFRDDYIRQMVLDELQNNSNLWLIIVDHNSKNIKERLSKGNDELQSRIMTMSDDIEKALSYRLLKTKHRVLEVVRDEETRLMDVVIGNKSLIVDSWKEVYKRYRLIEHLDRIKYMVKYLLENFEGEAQEQLTIQWIIFDLSLLFGIEYYIIGNQAESNYWLNIFRECSYVLDWVFSRFIDDIDLVFPKTKLPKWAEGANPETYSANFKDFEPMFNAIGKSMKIIHEEDIQRILNLLFMSLHNYQSIQGDNKDREEQIRLLKKIGGLWNNVSDRLIRTINTKLEINHSPTPSPLEVL